jgi:transketolase
MDLSLQWQQEMVKKAALIRKDIAYMTSRSKSSHIGSCYSIVEILVYLYGKQLHLSPESLENNDRDIFILSKGHAVAALYATLATYQFFDHALLDTFGNDGALLFGHPVRGNIHGIEASTGSLGHGLAIGTGFAMGKKMNHYQGRVYILLGDGECDEGSVWEAALIASHHQLDNITVLIDRNHQQGLGLTEGITRLDPIEEKWTVFGFETSVADGHNFAAIQQAFHHPLSGKPTLIVFNTIKGKGVSFMENQLAWHYRSLSTEDLALAIKEIEENANNLY